MKFNFNRPYLWNRLANFDELLHGDTTRLPLQHQIISNIISQRSRSSPHLAQLELVVNLYTYVPVSLHIVYIVLMCHLSILQLHKSVNTCLYSSSSSLDRI